MLQVNTNTYVTIAEADTYVTDNYITTESKRVSWEALNDTNKEIYLKRALNRMETFKYTGEKYERNNQTLSFPRRLYYRYPNDFKFLYPLDERYYRTTLYTGFGDNEFFPDQVKFAQIEEAIALASLTQTQKDSLNQRQMLQNQGVKSFRLSKLSESYDLTNNMRGGNGRSLVSQEAYELLSKYFVRRAKI